MKKLKLSKLTVKSFLTTDEAAAAKGGAVPETAYSCLKYLTCDVVRCYVTTQAQICVGE